MMDAMPHGGARALRAALPVLLFALAGCYDSWSRVEDGETSDAPGEAADDAGELPGSDWGTPEVEPDPAEEVDLVTDSDGDCIVDYHEAGVIGSDPMRADSDGDGATDLEEIIAGTDPNDPLNRGGPDPRFVVLPYGGPHEIRRLSTTYTLQSADVFFLIDSTISMGSAIENVSERLQTVIVPGIAEAMHDVQMGVGSFADFPVGGAFGYGGDSARPFRLLQTITHDVVAVQEAIDGLRAYGGGDVPESQVEALYQTATGEGIHPWVPPRTCTWGVGYPCFRPGVTPVIVLVTDAPMHSGPDGYETYDVERYPEMYAAADYRLALSALLIIGARVIGVYVDDSEDEVGYEHLERLATDTGTVDWADDPLVRLAPHGEVDSEIVTLVQAMSTETPMDMTATTRDVPGDPPGAEFDARLFVQGVTPVTAFPEPPRGYAAMTDEGFTRVRPGTRVTFEVEFANDVFEAVEHVHIFLLDYDVLGDSVTSLEQTRFVIIVVPEMCME